LPIRAGVDVVDAAGRSRIGPPMRARRRLPGKAAIGSLTYLALAASSAFAFEAGGTGIARNSWRMTPLNSAPNTARLGNARTPFRSGVLATAPPFFFGGDVTDRLRAIDCLAAAAYYEAGTSAIDQRAVIQVVLNRLRHPAFPRTVCGVVFQGSDRMTGCQFTFTCDGAMTRRQPGPLAWSQAQQVAQAALEGHAEAAVGLSTHYHTDWVLPAWSRQMDKVSAVNTHLFFRWRGGAGSPGSFSAHYGGGEPRIAKMEQLSAAHRAEPVPIDAGLIANPDLPAALTAPPLSWLARPGEGERLPDHLRQPDPDTFLVTLDASANPDSYLRLAERTCSGRSYCRFIGWTNPGRKADHLPIDGSAIDAITFSFTRTGPTEPDSARWNCNEFPRADQTQCLRRGADTIVRNPDGRTLFQAALSPEFTP
jgi:hypothetical protein